MYCTYTQRKPPPHTPTFTPPPPPPEIRPSQRLPSADTHTEPYTASLRPFILILWSWTCSYTITLVSNTECFHCIIAQNSKYDYNNNFLSILFSVFSCHLGMFLLLLCTIWPIYRFYLNDFLCIKNLEMLFC